MNGQHIAIITAVDAKHVERANGQSFDLWQVHDSDSNVWVVKKPLAEYARTLVGQQATFTTRHEQKMGAQGGVFDNYYADAIYPLNQPPQQYPNPLENPQGVTQQQALAMNAGWNPYGQQQPPPQYIPQQFPSAGVAIQHPADGQQSFAAQGSSVKDTQIARAVAVKAAAEVCQGDLYVLWTLLPDLMAFLEEGKLPANIAQATEFLERTVEASAEGATPSQENTDDDIPF